MGVISGDIRKGNVDKGYLRMVGIITIIFCILAVFITTMMSLPIYDNPEGTYELSLIDGKAIKLNNGEQGDLGYTFNQVIDESSFKTKFADIDRSSVYIISDDLSPYVVVTSIGTPELFPLQIHSYYNFYVPEKYL